MSKKQRVLTATIALLLSLALYLSAADDSPFRFAVIGDSGCGCDGQEEVAARMLDMHDQKPFQVVLMLGDNIYGRSSLLRGGNRRLFDDRFDDYYQPLLDRGVKFYAVLGNHDYETRNGRDLIADKERFNILGSRGYYAFTPVGEAGEKPLVTFYALNSVRLEDDDPDHEQVGWLSKALSESDSVWKIPFFHHPIATPPGAHSYSSDFLKRVENVFLAAGVQATFAGHNHFYARMKPQKDIVHFISGGGGRRLKTPRVDARTAVAKRIHHFILIELTPDKLQYWAVPPAGEPIDVGSIEKKTPA